MFKIDKSFECCYGHRVYNQTLDKKYSLDNNCVCRHLHGHQMLLKIGLSSTELNGGMVTDFKHLNCIKKFIDEVIDHKFIMDINDPLFSNLFAEIKLDSDLKWNHTKDDKRTYATVNFANFTNVESCVFEKLDGLVVVDFVPTSENLCKFFAQIAEDALIGLLGNRVRLDYVEFWETPKSHCKYELTR